MAFRPSRSLSLRSHKCYICSLPHSSPETRGVKLWKLASPQGAGSKCGGPDSAYLGCCTESVLQIKTQVMLPQLVSGPHWQTLLGGIGSKVKASLENLDAVMRQTDDRWLRSSRRLRAVWKWWGLRLVSTENACYSSVQNSEFLWLEGATAGVRKRCGLRRLREAEGRWLPRQIWAWRSNNSQGVVLVTITMWQVIPKLSCF